MEKTFYFEVLLDWIEESKPFFVKKTSRHRYLIDLIACFITPAFGPIKENLKAFRVNDNHNIIMLDPFTFECDMLIPGSRIVFSYRDICTGQEQNSFAMAFLNSDRSPLLSHWKIKSYLPLRLPRIYEPTRPLKITPDLNEEIAQIMCHPAQNASHLIVRGKSNIYLVELDNWGIDGAIQTLSSPASLNNITCCCEGFSQDFFYLVADGQLYKINFPELTTELETPEDLVKGENIVSLKTHDSQSRVYFLKNGKMVRLTPSGTHEFYTGRYPGTMEPNKLVWLPDGTFLFIDPVQESLVSTKINEPSAVTIFNLKYSQKYSHLTVDRESILYLVEGNNGLMHIFLPGTHQMCISCGYHNSYRYQKKACPECSSLMKKLSKEPLTYLHWLTLDLSFLGKPLGPLTVDEDLNIYLSVQSSSIAVITFSRRDMWGEQED